jgi:Circadian oscillating protein COP23
MKFCLRKSGADRPSPIGPWRSQFPIDTLVLTRVLISLTLSLSITTVGTRLPSQAATFSAITFDCPVGGRVLFARRVPTATQPTALSAPIIQFTSLGKFSGNQRCHEVAARFNYLNHSPGKNTLAFLTTGLRNGLPIVCSVQNYGDACDQTGGVQLLTLNPRDRAPDRRDQALSQLLVKLHNALSQTPVLLDNQPRLYINLQDFLNAAFAQVESTPIESTPIESTPIESTPVGITPASSTSRGPAQIP